MDKLLTIAIPTYNGEKTISRMLEILLPQCDERVEVIVSDNASIDGTGEIVKKFIQKYSFVEYIRNVHNIGPDSNFLQCMNLASGKYTLLLSDDDVLLEDCLSEILDFLEASETMSLIYLNAVGFHETYLDVNHAEKFDRAIYDDRSFTTKDKKEFMMYAGRMWGFLSCFICLTEAFKSLSGVEKFKKTNWLQSYVHIECSNYGEKRVGIIGKPCIGAGIYSIVSNYDSSVVDCLNYRAMLDFAIQQGYDKKQLDKLYIWRVCFLIKRNIIKERASGSLKTNLSTVFKCTYRYTKCWLCLYPFMLLPKWLCKFAVKRNAKKKNYTEEIHTNRVGDVQG